MGNVGKQIMSRTRVVHTLLIATLLTLLAGTTSAQFSLTTTYAAGNGSYSNMFNVTANAGGVQINRFDTHSSSTAALTYNIYVKTGTYRGSEHNAAAWTLHDTVATTGAGTGSPTNVTLNTPLVIPAGQTVGIYMYNTDNNQYTTGTGTAGTPNLYQDTYITIDCGAAVVGFFSGTINDPRIWNGTVHYIPITDSTLLTAANTGTSQFNPPVSNHVVMDMQAATFVNNNNLNSVTFSRSGTITDSDISAVTLYRDNNNDGVVDGGDTQLGTGALTSNTITFSGSPTLQALTAGAPARLLLAISIPAALNPGVNVQFSATSATWSGSGTDYTNYPLNGGAVWVTDPSIPFHIYLKMNEGTGTTTANSAIPGSGNNPITFPSNPPSWVSGRHGAAALSFATTTAAPYGLDTGWNASIGTGESWTIETWIQVQSSSSYVFRFGSSGLYLYYSTSTGLYLASTGGTPTTTLYFTNSPLTAGEWTHAAIVYDSTATEMRLYLNGALVKTDSRTAALSGTLAVGSLSPTSSSSFKGSLDEFRVWDKVRSQSDILAGMFQELPVQDSAVLVEKPTKSRVSTPVASHVVLDLDAHSFVTGKTLSSLAFSRSGTTADSDFSNITLYLDNNADGIVDGGDTSLGTGALSGGALTMNCAPAPSITAGTSVRLLLAVDIASTLTPGKTFQFNVTAATFSAGTDLTSYPVSGANWTVRTPLMPFNLYYKMNEGSGTTTANSAVPGVGDDPAAIGPTTAPTWVNPGAVGSHALDFSTGSGSGIMTGWTDGVSPADDWTIEMWMRLTATTSGYPFRFTGGGMYLYMTGGNFTLYGTGGATNPSWAAPALNTWQHVAIVYDATAGSVSVYLDGTLGSFATGKSPTGRGELIVGSYSTTSTRFYGQLDEFRFWDVARSNAEITAAMNVELPTSAATQLKASSSGGPFPTVPATDMVVMDMQADAFINNNSITSLTFTHIGTAPDTDITSVKLYRDNNSDGAVDAGDTLLGTGALGSGTVTFNSAPLPQALTAGTTVRLLLAVDVSAGFTLNNTIQFQLAGAADLGWGSAAPDFTAFPVVGGEWEYTTLVVRQLGAATTTNTIPFNSGTSGWRFQNAYSAAEINMPAGSVITEIRISSATVATPTYNNLRIRLAHTTLAVNALTTTFENNYSGNLATCLGPVNFSPVQNGDGYYVFPLAIPFLYNGTDGVLIDWSYDSRTGGGFTAQTNSGVRSRAYVSGTSANYLSPTATTLNTTGADFLSQMVLDYVAPSPQPVIQLSRTGVIANGGSDAIGSVSLQGDSFVWTITNTAAVADLHLGAPIEVRPGTGAPTVNITAQPATTIAGTTLTNFTLQVIPSAPGAFSFTVWITNDDISDNPFVFTVSGSGIAPDMEVSRNASPVVHTGADAIGNVPHTGASFTWTISNASASNLQVTTPITVTPGTGAPGVSVTTQPSNVVVQGTPTTFTILVTPSPGAFDFLVSIANNDPANNPYTFTVSGTGIAPIMEISRTAAVASGTVDNVGNVSTAGEPFTWDIDNSGTNDLSITTPITVTAGTGTPGFTVTTQPAASVAPAGTTSFTITITPQVGNFALSVSIASNDPTNNPYTFTIEGIGYIPNAPAQANPAAVSIFSGAVNGPFSTAIVPGSALANADIELTDAETDTITVTAITALTATPTGVNVPAIPAAGHPITLSWTGTANASNPPGSYTWEVTFEDAVNGTPVSVEVTIIIGDLPPTHAIANALGGNGSAGTPYTVNYTVSMTNTSDVDLASVTDPNVGQNPAITSITLGGSNPTTGVFNLALTGGFLNIAPSGTLVSGDVGTHTFDVEVSDGTNTINIHVAVTVAEAPAITTTTLPGGEQGQNYGPVNVVATGGTGTLTFAVSAGALPPGVTLSAAGVVAGLPTLAATYNFTVTATDALGISAQQALSIVIDPPATGTPTITTATLPAGTVNATYGPVTLQVTGGLAPHSFAITAGNLPAGLTMSPTGEISGTPTTAEIANFEVTVTDAAFASSTANLSITISASGGGGGSSGGGGCVANTSISSTWALLLGALALLFVASRLRAWRKLPS